MIRVKVCCISSHLELQVAIDAGASAVGLVASMPSGPGTVTDALIAELSSSTPAGVSRFLLTPEVRADRIVDHIERTGVDVVQVCDHVDLAVVAEVRRRTSVRVVAVVHVLDPNARAYSSTMSQVAHALLLDSGVPGADFKELGGTGRTHDWSVSADIVRKASCPVWLAGGLKASNIIEAIQTVRPFGVDLCTGVRTDGHLDPIKLAAFMKNVRLADKP